MAELEDAVLAEDGGVGAGGGGVDAEEVGLEVVDAQGGAVEGGLEVGPGAGEGVEEVGEAVVVEVEFADGLAEGGLEEEEVGLGPILDGAEAVVALGEDEGEPGADDLSGGEIALPVVDGVVEVEEGVDPQAAQDREEDRDVVGPLDADHADRLGVHTIRCSDRLARFQKCPPPLPNGKIKFSRA